MTRKEHKIQKQPLRGFPKRCSFDKNLLWSVALLEMRFKIYEKHIWRSSFLLSFRCTSSFLLMPWTLLQLFSIVLVQFWSILSLVHLLLLFCFLSVGMRCNSDLIEPHHLLATISLVSSRIWSYCRLVKQNQLIKNVLIKL